MNEDWAGDLGVLSRLSLGKRPPFFIQGGKLNWEAPRSHWIGNRLSQLKCSGQADKRGFRADSR